MKCIVRLFASILLLFLFNSRTFCQSQLSGTVTDSRTREKMSSVTILIPGTSTGTFTDNQGHFSLDVGQAFPVTLVFSAVGYRTDTVQAVSSRPLQIKMRRAEVLGSEIVVAASRVPESILTSPVSIEHIGAEAIRQAPAANYYDIIGSMKGVDIVTSGLLFSAPTTRGFGGSGNTGVNQFTDGMNNEAPGLNFSVGNVSGISELDIDNIELLPGASSALYGAGGTNGTILMTSKDPFQYQGLSVQVKEGMMHLGDSQHKATPYQQYDARYARAFNNKFAFKLNFGYIKAYDWIASDTDNYDAANFGVKPGSRSSDPAYDGINVYGDETSVNMLDVAQGVLDAATRLFSVQFQQQTGTLPSQDQINHFLAANSLTQAFYQGITAGLIPDQNVTRTGWDEKYLVDYNTFNLKIGGELAYKITSDMKISALARYGGGTTVYTGSDRYALKKFSISQYKIQLDGKHFMLRAYTTQENAGDAYNATVMGQIMNEGWKPSQQWFPEYVGAYAGAKAAGASDQQAFTAARSLADQGMPQPGTARFNALRDSVGKMPIPAGAAFKDKSGMYQYEGLYNFAGQIPFVDLQIGADYRVYRLRSDGTIFDDLGKRLTINQYGMFSQLTKSLFSLKLKLTGSIRYDKTENFAGKWTPRIAAVWTVAPENNIRVSYQTGYKLPTNQDQYIDLNVGRARLIGGLPQFVSKYDLKNNPGFLLNNVTQYGIKYQTDYQANLQQNQPAALAQYHAAVSAEQTLKPYEFRPFKPESVHAYEVGYRGIIAKKLMLDAYVYFSNYQDFIGSVFLLQAKNGPQPISPLDTAKYYGPQLAGDETRNVYQTKVNSEGTIKTWGWALGGEYALPRNFRLVANISYNKLSHAPKGFFTQFNTPDYRANISFGNTDVYRGIGFNITYRYQDAFRYEGSFAVGNVPAVNTIDAQLNYTIPKYKLSFKAGGTNILNRYYQNAFGNPMIGSLYYFSVGYNVF